MKKYQQQSSIQAQYQDDQMQPFTQQQNQNISRARSSSNLKQSFQQNRELLTLSKALLQSYSQGFQGSLRCLNVSQLGVQVKNSKYNKLINRGIIPLFVNQFISLRLAIKFIDIIDPRIASQVLELDLSSNMLTSLQNIEQFNSLAKLNLKNNLLKSIQELGHLANLDHLELLSVEGNPFQEDERYIQKFVATTLRNIKRLDIYIKSKNQPNEYLVMSSPSQATTGGAGGYSTSLQNIPDLMKELSNFSNSNTRQNPSGITSAITHQQQPLQKLNTNQFPANSLINAKIGKNNVKSRRDSNEGPLGLSSITNHQFQEDKKESGHHKDRKESQTAIHANIKDDFLDSFDMLNLSSDQNMIDINLKQCRDLQTRMTNNLKGINSHCQILSNGSQERDSQLNSTNNIV